MMCLCQQASIRNIRRLRPFFALTIFTVAKPLVGVIVILRNFVPVHRVGIFRQDVYEIAGENHHLLIGIGCLGKLFQPKRGTPRHLLNRNVIRSQTQCSQQTESIDLDEAWCSFLEEILHQLLGSFWFPIFSSKYARSYDTTSLLGCPWYLVNGLFHPYRSRSDTSPE